LPPQGVTEKAPDHGFLGTVPFIHYGSKPDARLMAEEFYEGRYTGNYFEPTMETKIYFQSGLVIDLMNRDK
jgi:hypothetical protein